MSVIGDRMRELRGSSSLKEMGDAIGIKYSAWARYEAGEVSPGAEIITKICAAHAVSADWLLGIERGASTAIASGNHSVAVAGFNASVKIGESPSCAKCPYKKKLKQLEKILK